MGEPGLAGHELEHSVRARNEMSRRLAKRRDRDMGSLHSFALQLNGRALARRHDAGAPGPSMQAEPPPWEPLGMAVLLAQLSSCKVMGRAAVGEHAASARHLLRLAYEDWQQVLQREDLANACSGDLAGQVSAPILLEACIGLG